MPRSQRTDRVPDEVWDRVAAVLRDVDRVRLSSACRELRAWGTRCLVPFDRLYSAERRAAWLRRHPLATFREVEVNVAYDPTVPATNLAAAETLWLTGVDADTAPAAIELVRGARAATRVRLAGSFVEAAVDEDVLDALRDAAANASVRAVSLDRLHVRAAVRLPGVHELWLSGCTLDGARDVVCPDARVLVVADTICRVDVAGMPALDHARVDGDVDYRPDPSRPIGVLRIRRARVPDHVGSWATRALALQTCGPLLDVALPWFWNDDDDDGGREIRPYWPWASEGETLRVSVPAGRRLGRVEVVPEEKTTFELRGAAETVVLCRADSFRIERPDLVSRLVALRCALSRDAAATLASVPRAATVRVLRCTFDDARDAHRLALRFPGSFNWSEPMQFDPDVAEFGDYFPAFA